MVMVPLTGNTEAVVNSILKHRSVFFQAILSKSVIMKAAVSYTINTQPTKTNMVKCVDTETVKKHIR